MKINIHDLAEQGRRIMIEDARMLNNARRILHDDKTTHSFRNFQLVNNKGKTLLMKITISEIKGNKLEIPDGIFSENEKVTIRRIHNGIEVLKVDIKEDELPVKIVKEPCPKCGLPLITDDDNVWCSNGLCNYEYYIHEGDKKWT